MSALAMFCDAAPDESPRGLKPAAQVDILTRNTTVDVERIDGQRTSGAWIGCPDAESVRLLVGGAEIDLPIDDLSTIVFRAPDVPSVGRHVFHLADGGTLFGSLRGSRDDTLLVDCLLSEELAIPFDRLAGVRLASGAVEPQGEQIFRATLAARPSGEDVLITRGEGDSKAVRGRLIRLEPDGGSFEFGGRARRFRSEKVFGVVFALGAGETNAQAVRVTLIDGSRVGARIERADGEVLTLATSLNRTVDVSLTLVARLEFYSDRVVYLSDLTPIKQHVEGILHRAWPVRRDQSVAARPLSIDGRTFARGIGCHSRSELTYDLGGLFERFVATVGIDDGVRPRGNVVFRVLGDGKLLFDSGELTGHSPAREVNVRVVDVGKLTLVCDYGADLDLSDHADWGGARLLRAHKSP